MGHRPASLPPRLPPNPRRRPPHRLGRPLPLRRSRRPLLRRRVVPTPPHLPLPPAPAPRPVETVDSLMAQINPPRQSAAPRPAAAPRRTPIVVPDPRPAFAQPARLGEPHVALRSSRSVGPAGRSICAAERHRFSAVHAGSERCAPGCRAGARSFPQLHGARSRRSGSAERARGGPAACPGVRERL